MSEPQQEIETAAQHIPAETATHSDSPVVPATDIALPVTQETQTVSTDETKTANESSKINIDNTASSSSKSCTTQRKTTAQQIESEENSQKDSSVATVTAVSQESQTPLLKREKLKEPSQSVITVTPNPKLVTAEQIQPVRLPSESPVLPQVLTPSSQKTAISLLTANSVLKSAPVTPVLVTPNVATLINPNSHVEHWNLDSFLPGEDKNPFSDISEEHLNQLADALSTEDVTSLLQTDFGPLESTLNTSNIDTSSPLVNKSRDSLNSDDSLKLDLFETESAVFDEATAHKMIRDGVHEHELAVMSAAFSDHAYAIPTHHVVDHTGDTNITISPLPTFSVTSASQTSDELTVDVNDEDQFSASDKRGEEDSPSRHPKRRSIRISDQEQKDLAEKIRQENRQKEREAKEALIAKKEDDEFKKGNIKIFGETEEEGSGSCSSDPQKSKRGRKFKPTAKAQLFRQSRAARGKKTDDSDEQTPKGKKGRPKKVKENVTEESTEGEESPQKVAKAKDTEDEMEDRTPVGKNEKTEESSDEEEEIKPKRGKGRPPKKKTANEKTEETDSEKKVTPKRRGRPPKVKKEEIKKEEEKTKEEETKEEEKKEIDEDAKIDEDTKIDEDGKNDQDAEKSKPKSRSPGRKRKQVLSPKEEDKSSDDDEPLKVIKEKGKKSGEVSSSDEEQTKGKKKRVVKKGKVQESEDESVEDTPKKGKKKGRVGRKGKTEESDSESVSPKKGKAVGKDKADESSDEEVLMPKGKKVKLKTAAKKDKKGKKDVDGSDTEKQTPKGKKKKPDEESPKKAGKKDGDETMGTPKMKKSQIAREAGEKKKKEKSVDIESEEDLPLQHLKSGQVKHKDKTDDDKHLKNDDDDVDVGAEFRYPSKQHDSSHKHRRRSHKMSESEFVDPSMTELFKPDVKDDKTKEIKTGLSGDDKVENLEVSEKNVEDIMKGQGDQSVTVLCSSDVTIPKSEPSVVVVAIGDGQVKKGVEKLSESSDSIKDRLGGDGDKTELTVRKLSSDNQERKYSVHKIDRKDSSDSRERTSSVDSENKHKRKSLMDKHERKHSTEKHERKHSTDKHERKHLTDKHERKHSTDKHEQKHSTDKHDRKSSIEKLERKHSTEKHDRKLTEKHDRKPSVEKPEKKPSTDGEKKHSAEKHKRRHSSDKHDKEYTRENSESKDSIERRDSVSKDGSEKSQELKRTRGKKLKHRHSKDEKEKGDDDDEDQSDESGELSFEDDENDSDWEPANDPNSQYCICRKPHNNRFMICCDNCEEWYHGSCVGISKSRGKDMEKNNEEYICPVCTKALKAGTPQTSEAESIKTPTKSVEVTKPVEVIKPEVKVTPGSTSKVSSTTSSTSIQSKEGQLLGEIKKRTAKETEEKKKQGFKAFRNMEDKLLKVQKLCIRKQCNKDVRPGTIYCSDECISHHAQHSLKLIKQDRELIAVSKGIDVSTLKGNIKLHVLERKSGVILSGSDGPTEATLVAWLQEHPTFQVIRPKVKMKLPSPYLIKLQKERKDRERQKEELRRKEEEKERERQRRKREWEKEKEREKAEKLKKESEQKNKADGPDPIRLNVRKSLRDALANRTKDADDMMFSTNEIKAIALKIEDCLFKCFEDTGHKYKNKYRTLVFNIRDPKNKGLFRKILTGQIKPSKLIHMSHDDLASKELAKWRKKETKHTLELIETAEKKAQKEPVTIRKKTHKGEVEVEDEDLSTLAETLIEDKSTVASVTDELKREEGNDGEGDDGVVDVITDTTEQHRAHLFDLNCKICTGKQAPAPQDPDTKKMKVEHKVKESKQVRKEKEQLAAKEKVEAEADEVIKEVMEVIQKEDEKPVYPAPTSSSKTVIVRSPDSALASGLDSKPKFKPQGPRLWKGFVAMQDLAKFFTSAYKVSGPTNDLNLPDTIAVCGRIAPDQMWDYLAKIRQGGSRDICIVRFIPGSDDEKVAYIHLYSYLNSRGRCGVVGNAPKHVKDFYIVPLASHGHIPRVLKPFDGPESGRCSLGYFPFQPVVHNWLIKGCGLEDNRPHMLLGIIIRQKLKRSSQSNTTVLPKQKEEASSAKKARVNTSGLPPKDPRLERASRAKTFSPSTDPGIIKYKPTKLEELKASSSSSSTSSSPDLVAISKDPIVKAFTDPKSADESPKLSISLPYSPGGGEDDTEDSPYDPTDSNILPTSSQMPSATATSTLPITAATTSISQMPKLQASTLPKKKLKDLSDTESITGIKVDDIVDKIAKSTDPAQITAMMVTILACASDASEQKVLLTQLTNRVETRKQILIKQTLGDVKTTDESRGKLSEVKVAASDKEKSDKSVFDDQFKAISSAAVKPSESDTKPVQCEMSKPVGFYTSNSTEISNESKKESKKKPTVHFETMKEVVKDVQTKTDIVKESVKENVVSVTDSVDSSSDSVEPQTSVVDPPAESSAEKDEPTAAAESSSKTVSISISETKTGDMPLALQALMKDVMGESAVRTLKPRLPARFTVDKGKEGKVETLEEKRAAGKEKDSKSTDSEKKEKVSIESIIPGLGYLDTDSDEEYSGTPHLFMDIAKKLKPASTDSSVGEKEKPSEEDKPSGEDKTSKDKQMELSKDKQMELSKSDLDMRSGQLSQMKPIVKDEDFRAPARVEDIDERIKPAAPVPMDKDDRVLGPLPLPSVRPPVRPPVRPSGPIQSPGLKQFGPDGYPPVVRPPPIRIPRWGPGNPPPPGVDDPISPETKIRPPPGIATHFRAPTRPPFPSLLPPRIGFAFASDAKLQLSKDTETFKKDSPESSAVHARTDATVSSSQDPSVTSKKDSPVVSKDDSVKDTSKRGSPVAKKDEGSSKKAKKEKSAKESKSKSKKSSQKGSKEKSEDVDERVLPPIIPGVPMKVSLPGIPVAISVVPPNPSGLDPITTEIPPQWPRQSDVDQRMFVPAIPNPMMPVPMSSVSMTAPNSPMLVSMPNSPMLVSMPNSPMLVSMPNNPSIAGPSMSSPLIGNPPINIPHNSPSLSLQPSMPASPTAAWMPPAGPQHLQQHPPDHMLGQPPQPVRDMDHRNFTPAVHGNPTMTPSFKDVDFRQLDVDLRPMKPPPMPPGDYYGQSSPNADGGFPHKRPYEHEHSNEPHGKRSRPFGGPFRPDGPPRDSKPPSLMSMDLESAKPEPECSHSPNAIDYFEQQEFIGGYYHGVKNPRGGGWNYQRGKKSQRGEFPHDYRNVQDTEGGFPPESGDDRLLDRQEGHESRGFGRERRPWGSRHDRRPPRDQDSRGGYHHDDARHREGFHRGRRRDSRDYRR